MGVAKLVLHVVGGVDRGARITLDAPKRTIGRALKCDLVLHDGEVSRKHAVVVCTQTGARLEICEGAKPAIVDGHAVRHFDLQAGIKFIIGSTTIAVLEGRSKRVSVRDESDAETEISGVGASARHLTALAELVDVLDAIDVVDQLESRTRAWCIEQDLATDARLDSSATRATTTISISKDGKGMVHFAVPMPDGALVFACRSSDGDIPESLRKVLVMASRLFSSALARTRRLRVVANQAAAFRTMSLGSAREFLGSSTAARHLARSIPQLAASDANVLLKGETGSGKTFVAHLIHECGPRAKEPLRVINCATDAIESELFGELEVAGRGTVLLDEIGELPPSTQVKLVRVLDERHFSRLGSRRTIPLEARVMATTTHDLQAMVSEGRFRDDLYFRLATVCVIVPTLRERGEDVLELAEHILRDLVVSRGGRRVEGFYSEALEAIVRYTWPGNVRELHNAIEHALLLGVGPKIEASDLPAGISTAGDQALSSDLFHATLPADMASLELRNIQAALAVTGQNRTRAAALLDIHRNTLLQRIKEMESKKSDSG